MLQQLGINATVIVQFVIFIATFVALIKLVYEPFTAVHLKRLQNTKGSVEIADDIHKKSQELHAQYSAKAKEVHTKISEIFKEYKTEANSESDKILMQAKAEANTVLESNRKNIQTRSAQLETELKDMKSGLVMAINNKLLGKS
jgi:F-type H+-transporting ATPase subunit b